MEENEWRKETKKISRGRSKERNNVNRREEGRKKEGGNEGVKNKGYNQVKQKTNRRKRKRIEGKMDSTEDLTSNVGQKIIIPPSFSVTATCTVLAEALCDVQEQIRCSCHNASENHVLFNGTNQ